jgi:hypothetical protein
MTRKLVKVRTQVASPADGNGIVTIGPKAEATVRMLVCWWEIPEELSFVQLMVDAKTAEKIRSWHNIFINQDGTPEEVLTELNDFFYDSDGRFRFPKKNEPLVGVVLDYVVITGFFL